jgi:uncharacterized membrane protein
MEKTKTASKVLGIVGICVGWLIPLVGIVLGIIGLCVKKEQGKENRDIALNVISVAEGIIFWIIGIIMAFTILNLFA